MLASSLYSGFLLQFRTSSELFQAHQRALIGLLELTSVKCLICEQRAVFRYNLSSPGTVVWPHFGPYPLALFSFGEIHHLCFV